MKLAQSVAGRKATEGLAFHQRGVGLVEETAGRFGPTARGLLFFGWREAEFRLPGVEVDAVERDVFRCGAGHDEQQFLAFALHADGMHLCRVGQRAQGLADVQHGRELDKAEARPAADGLLQGVEVRLAVADGHGLASRGVAPCGVDEAAVGFGPAFRRLGGVGFAHFGLRQPQHPEVVCGDAAQFRLPFHVDGAVEQWGEEAEIDAETAGEVRQYGGGRTARCEPPPHDVLFVACRLFRRALFHGKPGREKQSFALRP